MIVIKLKYGDQGLNFSFPCLHEYIRYQLAELGVDTETAPKLLVESVAYPCVLSCLEGTYVNIDEINYLVREIESLEEIQAEKLYAIIAYKGYKTPKDLINAKFNLDCYTLIQDVRNLEKIGRMHLSTLKGGLTQEELDTVDFAKIGRELIESGKGIYTEYGILFRNEEIEYKEAYDGQVFPEGWYGWEKHVLEVEIGYNGKSEYVYLPEEELGIRKAIHRLGAPSAEACAYTISGYNFPSDWCKRFTRLLETESIFPVNVLAQEIMYQKVDFDKLSAACGYVGKWDLDTLLSLVKNIDEFEYLERAQNYKSVGILALNRILDTKFPAQAAQFMDYEGYGKYLSSNQGGRFVAGGFIYLREGITIQDILQAEETPTELQPEPRL